MTAQRKKKDPEKEDLPGHWARQLPYRAVVYVRSNGDTPLFQVAGSTGGPWGAATALKEAAKIHQACCFYCRKDKKRVILTLDHVEPRSRRGSWDLSNLVLACQSCNRDKGNRQVEAFDREAGVEWLSGLLREIQGRLNRLN